MKDFTFQLNALRIRHAQRVSSFLSEGYTDIFTVKNDLLSRYTRLRHKNGNAITVLTDFHSQIIRKNGKIIEKRDFTSA